VTDDAVRRKIIIIAGPNGAGKTTFAATFLSGEASIARFVNADRIAASLADDAPELVALRAGRLMLEEIASCVRDGESFAFETTLSGLSYLPHIRRWRQQGYRVILMFLSLPSADWAVERVALRVEQGGHHIPEEVIRRRFASGLDNFHSRYKGEVDEWILYDNSDVDPALLDLGERN
jgi:predicted ABC-type ATPase